MDEKLMLGIKQTLQTYYGEEKYRAKFPQVAKFDQKGSPEAVKRAVVENFLSFLRSYMGYSIVEDISLDETTRHWRPVDSDSLVDEFLGINRAKLAEEQKEMVSVFTELLLNQSIGPHNDGG